MVVEKVSIIGAGSWGTALAVTAARAGHDVTIWSRNIEVVRQINQQHENVTYLKNITLPDNIEATADLRQINDSQLLLLTVPAQALRATCLELALSLTNPLCHLVICCKGIEQQTLKLMHEVVHDIFPSHPIAVLSGPNFADEVAKNLPPATAIAAHDLEIAKKVANILSSINFRTYFSDDIVGVQIGGAVKNVIAIACGITVGKKLGENAKAALITRGLAEISRLCYAKSGKPQTLMGLAGVGDLILTCNSKKSRNMSLGISLGEGQLLQEILKSSNEIIEGMPSAQAVCNLAAQLQVEMPIVLAINKILYGQANIEQTITELLLRPTPADENFFLPFGRNS